MQQLAPDYSVRTAYEDDCLLGVYSFDVQFRKESGEWLVVSAKWERIGDADKR